MNYLWFSWLAVALWGLWEFLSKVATLQLPAGGGFGFSGRLAVIEMNLAEKAESMAPVLWIEIPVFGGYH